MEVIVRNSRNGVKGRNVTILASWGAEVRQNDFLERQRPGAHRDAATGGIALA